MTTRFCASSVPKASSISRNFGWRTSANDRHVLLHAARQRVRKGLLVVAVAHPRKDLIDASLALDGIDGE
jgi:hypothetical protein